MLNLGDDGDIASIRWLGRPMVLNWLCMKFRLAALPGASSDIQYTLGLECSGEDVTETQISLLLTTCMSNRRSSSQDDQLMHISPASIKRLFSRMLHCNDEKLSQLMRIDHYTFHSNALTHMDN